MDIIKQAVDNMKKEFVTFEYANNYVIGLCQLPEKNDEVERYCIFWAKVNDPEVDIEQTNFMNDGTIRLHLMPCKNCLFNMMILDKKSDYPIAKKMLQAVLFNE